MPRLSDLARRLFTRSLVRRPKTIATRTASRFRPAVEGLEVRDVPAMLPMPMDDDATTRPGQPVWVDVLSNDSDDDGSLQLVGVGQPGGGAGAAAVDGSQVRFTPASTFSGDVTFWYAVDDGIDGGATASVTVHVTNTAPYAMDDWASTHNAAVAVDVLSNDMDMDGDGMALSGWTQPAHGTVTAGGSGGTLVYTPAAGYAGGDAFRYTVTDGYGGTTTGTVSIDVVNSGPSVMGTTVMTHNGPVAVDVLATAYDMDGDALTLAGIVSGPAHGALSVQGGSVTYTPAAGYSGSDGFSFAVTDGYGGAEIGWVSIDVMNSPPMAESDWVSTHGGPVTVAVLANDTDMDYDTLTVVSVSGGVGSVVVNPDGTVTWTSPAGYHGGTQFQYVVTDGYGGSTGTVTIDFENSPPMAEGDQAHAYGEPIVIPVLANDMDMDNDPRTVTAVTGGVGRATINPDGTLTYTPKPGFAGDDVFFYTVSDGHGGTGTGSVTVNNDPPAAPATQAAGHTFYWSIDGSLGLAPMGSALGTEEGAQPSTTAPSLGDVYIYSGPGITADDGLPSWFRIYATPGENGLSVTYKTWRDLFGTSQDELFEYLAGSSSDEIPASRLMLAVNEGGAGPSTLTQADDLFRTRWSVTATPSDPESGTPPPASNNWQPPPEVASPLPTGDQSYQETAWRIYNQFFNVDMKSYHLRALRVSPLYAADADFRALVDRYAVEIGRARIDQLPAATSRLLLSPTPVLDGYVRNHPNGPDAIAALDARKSQLLGPVILRYWHETTAKTEREIATALERAAIPRVYRYIGGMGMAVAKALNGTVEAAAYFDRIPAGAWSLLTDVDTQARVIQAVIDKLSDGSAENIGELTVEIPLAVSGTAGAVRTGAAAITYSGKLVVRVSRETVAAIRAATPEARAGLQARWWTGANSRPAGMGSGYQLPATIARQVKDDFASINTRVAERMTQLGVEAEYQGIRGLLGYDDTPFTDTPYAIGGANIRPDHALVVQGRAKAGIYVDGAVFDPAFDPLLGKPVRSQAARVAYNDAWKQASVDGRIDAVIAHEYSELLATRPATWNDAVNGVWDPHKHAIIYAADMPGISVDARAMLELLRDAYGYVR